MDKFEKAFQKLSSKERRQLEELLTRLEAGNFKSLDIKKLKGSSDIFRVRKGSIRVIYRFKNGKIFLIHISRRSEQTYKGF